MKRILLVYTTQIIKDDLVLFNYNYFPSKPISKLQKILIRLTTIFLSIFLSETNFVQLKSLIDKND